MRPRCGRTRFAAPVPAADPKPFQTADYTPNSVRPLAGLGGPFICRGPLCASPRRGTDGLSKRNFGLASGGACPAVRISADAVRSYRTFSPLPLRAVCSLWRYPSAGDVAPASRPMPRTYNAARFEPAPCPVKFGSSSPPLREERPSVRGLKIIRRSLSPATYPAPAQCGGHRPGSGSPTCPRPCSSRAARAKYKSF